MEHPSVQVGLRVPESVNTQLEQYANRIGVSKNALILMLIDMGFKVVKGSITFLPPQE